MVVGNKHREVAQVIYEWLSELVSAEDATPQWLTYHQLLADFQRTTGHPGVYFKLSSKRYLPLEEWYILHEYKFTRVARSFGACLKGLAGQWDEQFTFALQRPSGYSYHCWANCLFVKASKSRVTRLDSFWKQTKVSPISCVETDMDYLPR